MEVQSKISINRITDNHLITEFIYEVLINDKFSGAVNFKSVTLSIHGAPFVIQKSDLNPESGKIDKLDFIEGKNSESISFITLNTLEDTFSFSYSRVANSFIDEIIVRVRPQNNYPNTSRYELTPTNAKVLSEISDSLIRYTTPSNSSNVNHDVVLSKLEGISADLISKQHAHLRQIEDDKQKYFDDTQKILLDKIKELENKYSEKDIYLKSEYEEKNNELAEREKRIIAEDNTTARRQTTRDLLKSVIERAEKFSFSSGVNIRGYLIIFLCFVLGGAGFFNAYESSVYLSKFSEPVLNGYSPKYLFGINEWFNVGKVVTGSILFITSILYLIKWMNQWANKIADIELDYQKFSRDLNRADLTIEMCLEWSDKKDGEIPQVLLSSLTSGIFTEIEHKAAGEINHPVEQLAAALLKSAEKIELPLGGGKITTSGKNLTKN